MCWKTMGLVAGILLLCFFMNSSASVDKEGFVTYVVYGPEGVPGFGGWPFGQRAQGRGWRGPYGYRPYWHWRRRLWNPYY